MIKFLIEKEFKQLWRNSFFPRMIAGMPILMMLILPWAANQEIKDINLSIVDNDYSTYSSRLIHKTTASGYFRLTDVSASNREAMKSIEYNDADIIFEIENGFERNLYREGVGKVMISANAVNSMKSGLGSSYLVSIINDFANELRDENMQVVTATTVPQIEIIPQNRFNPHLDYKVFMVPAIMVILLTIISGFLPALNIVSEKEIGTIEQMNVTPVSKFTFIIAKLIPYWIIGFIVLTLCLLVAAFLYRLIPVGNLVTLYIVTGLYILVVSGVGLVISNYSDTMQQAMFLMFFFVLIFILMSGLFTPVSSMPVWAQKATVINPLKYFIEVMRMLFLKGSRIADLSGHILALCGFAVLFNGWAIISYRKSS